MKMRLFGNLLLFLQFSSLASSFSPDSAAKITFRRPQIPEKFNEEKVDPNKTMACSVPFYIEIYSKRIKLEHYLIFTPVKSVQNFSRFAHP
jgi:hypothetical protein